MIKLIIDSASDITMAEAKSLGITMIPLEVSFGDKVYLDGVDIEATRFYEMLIESDTIPKTSQINPYRFSQVFDEVSKNQDEAIVITLSSKLSGTYQSACIAAMEYECIHVVDSLNAAVGIRLLIMHALDLINKGLTAKVIVDELNEARKNIVLIAVLGTLEYLKKGGRISSVVAFGAELFSIKPVIGIVDGEVKLIGKARGSRNGNNLLNKEIEKASGIDFNMPLAVIYSGFDNHLANKYIVDSKNIWEGKIDEVPLYPIGCTIGTHIGPDAVGVAFFKNKNDKK